jgi:hypothetical protein
MFNGLEIAEYYQYKNINIPQHFLDLIMNGAPLHWTVIFFELFNEIFVFELFEIDFKYRGFNLPSENSSDELFFNNSILIPNIFLILFKFSKIQILIVFLYLKHLQDVVQSYYLI